MIAMIDTCVIIDVLQGREPFREAGEKIFLAAANRLFLGYITAKSVADIYYLMHRSLHDDKKTRDVLEKLFDIFDIADTTCDDCTLALASAISDYEDAIMAESASRLSMDCIITRNIKDYKNSDIKVYTPDEFLSLISAYTSAE